MFAAPLAVVFAALPSLADSAAVEFQYTGTLTPAKLGKSDQPVKRFTLYGLYEPQNTGGRLSWVIDERGGGGWAWPERFGRIALDKNHQPQGKIRIRLLHDHQGTKYPLEVRLPLFEFAGRLARDSEWKNGQTRYEIIGRKKINGHDCRRVTVTAPRGRSQRVDVAVDSAIVIRFEQTVFMGRGDRFRLKGELQSVKAVDKARLAKINAPLKNLLKLQADLKRRENQTRSELSDEQLKAVEATLKSTEKLAEKSPWHSLVAFIKGDLASQRKRAGEVTTLAAKIVGKPAPKFTLLDARGRKVDRASLKGNVVLLHFWSYNGDALEEPYGQVGYIDYLFNKRKKLGLKVYGVAVDSRLAANTKRVQALRSIRKLTSFMNLEYPVLLDDGDVLKSFGDPRAAGAKLPLWVAIDHTGKVRLYKAGFYKIQPKEGLRPLDLELLKLIREQRKGN